MESRRDSDKSKIKAVFAAQMHAVGLNSLFRAEAGHLGGGNDGGAGAFGNADGIADMVFMTVGNQNVLAVDLIGLGGCLRIAGQKGIDDQRVASFFEYKTGMTQKFQFRHFSSSFNDIAVIIRLSVSISLLRRGCVTENFLSVDWIVFGFFTEMQKR